MLVKNININIIEKPGLIIKIRAQKKRVATDYNFGCGYSYIYGNGNDYLRAHMRCRKINSI